MAIDLNPNAPKKGVAPLTIKDEQVIFYGVDDLPESKQTVRTEEELEALEKDMEEYDANLKALLLSTTFQHICNCHQPEIMQREMAKAAVIQTQGPRMITFQQEDIDNYVYGVIGHSVDGKYEGNPMLYAMQCRRCGSIKLFGDLRPLIMHLGEVYRDKLDMIFGKSKDSDNAEGVQEGAFMMENLETGEKVPAENLAEALFGEGTSSDSVRMDKIPDKPEAE